MVDRIDVISPRFIGEDKIRIELDGLFQGGLESAHFLCQLYNLPASEPPNARRVLQVAYNIGQLKGSGGPGDLAVVHRVNYVKWELENMKSYVQDDGTLLTPTQAQELLDLLGEPVSKLVEI